MKRFLPLSLILITYLATVFSVAKLVFAYSYGDFVEVNGYQYSACTGSGNFGYTNDNYYVCDANPCGGSGRITVAPDPNGCFSAGVFFANRSSVSEIGGTPTPTTTPTVTSTPTPIPTPTPVPCPYVEIRSTFQSGSDPANVDLTLAVNSQVSAVAVGVKAGGSLEIIPEGKVRNHLTQNTAEAGWDPLFENGADLSNPTGAFQYRFGGTYTLMSTPIDNAGNAIESCVEQSVIGLAGLTVVGCPFRETTVMIADRDKDPFTYYEEDSDQPTFCGYGKGGVCTPTMKTRYQKNLRFKVMRQSLTNQVIDGPPDARILVRRFTSPEIFVQECDATTGGTVNSGDCLSGDGYTDYLLDPNDTSLTALQSGGATDDNYTVQATTLVTKNGQTFEISTPGCIDTDEVQADACLYDSTQAYLRNKFAKPEEFKWTSNFSALRNDTIQFGAFHNFDNPETQSVPAFPTDTVVGLTGPYGINPIYGPGKLSYNPDERKLDLAGKIANGEYRFDVATNRIKDGTTYKLDKSEFCSARGSLKVSTSACVAPAPVTSSTKCCPTKPEGTSWSFSPIIRTLLSPFQALPLRIKLGITKFETTTDTKKIADYFFGRDNEGQVDKGIYFKSAPPYEIADKFPTETEEIQKRRELAQYSFNINNQNETELTKGSLENLPAAAYGAERVHKSWAARPLRDEDLLAINPSKELGNVLGSATPVCSEIRYSTVTENACFTETDGAETDGAGINDFFTIANGGLDTVMNLFTDKLDWLGAYVGGYGTTDTQSVDSAAKRDTAFASGGLNKIFLRPGEESPPEKAGDAKANLVLGFQVNTGSEWQWIPEARIEFPLAQAALRFVGGAKNVVDFIRERGLRPGEVMPEEPLPSGTPTPTPSVTPSVTPPPPAYIPQTDTSVAVATDRKTDIINFVKAHWPASPIESQWNYVYNTGRNYGYNPAFIIALWIEESGASGVSAWDFGCTGAPKNNIPAGLSCMNGLSYKTRPWEEFACKFSEGHYPCSFTINPNFPRNISKYYQCVTESSCSLF